MDAGKGSPQILSPRKSFSLLLLLSVLAGCAGRPALSGARAEKLARFQKAVKSGEEIWSPATPAESRHALKLFEGHAKLDNGLLYGDSVRHLDLSGKSVAEIEKLLASRNCRELRDLLHDPKTGKASLCAGRAVEQLLFDCPDGGLVRLKPDGDPCSKQRPQPHGVKSVRFPYNADPRDFSHKAFKVDRDDLPLPKSPAHLHPAVEADGWAEDAHTDLPLQ